MLLCLRYDLEKRSCCIMMLIPPGNSCSSISSLQPQLMTECERDYWSAHLFYKAWLWEKWDLGRCAKLGEHWLTLELRHPLQINSYGCHCVSLQSCNWFECVDNLHPSLSAPLELLQTMVSPSLSSLEIDPNPKTSPNFRSARFMMMNALQV